jgi:DNA-binding NarL/FixJ family response regulator
MAYDGCARHSQYMRGDSTLLIVEDNPAVRSVVEAYMSRHGDWSVVISAPDAGRALMLAAEHEPGAIVLDNRMPGGDGIDVLPALRRACPDAVIVIHTSDDSWAVREAAEESGADAVVGKGRPLDELVAILHVS